MDIEDARVVAADILINGITTKFHLCHVRAAYDALFIEGLAHKDRRPEQGALLILHAHIDTLTTLTSEV